MSLTATATTAFLVLALSTISLGDMVRISNANELIEFSENVNSKVSYEGTTVILEGDIDFTEELSKQFEPIGKDYSEVEACFTGIFDGQGYTISNLNINSTNPHVGLFGFSTGNLTIRNTIIDSSCSFESNYDQGFRVGGFIAYFVGSKGGITIENSINMGSIYFSGITNNAIEIGGLVGESMGYKFETLLTNSANYGPITYSGTVTSRDTSIGGLMGSIDGGSGVSNSIQNCANYGQITVGGSSTNANIGGFIGYNYYCTVKNCISGGKLSTTATKKNIGAIVGYTLVKGDIINCYWPISIGSYEASGTSLAVTDSSNITSNEETLATLNANAEANSWNKWILASNDASISFKANNNGKAVVFTSEWVLMPKFESDWKDFEGWYDGNTQFTSTTISESKELTGKWIFNKDFTLSFDFGNGTALNETYKFNAAVTYPDVADTADKFFVWEKYITVMPGEDTVVRGIWMNISVYVKITFGRNDLTDEGIRNIINKYTTDAFTITLIEDNEEGNTKIITKFTSTAEATNFVRTAMRDKTPDEKIVKIETITVATRYTLTFDFGNGTTLNETHVSGDAITYPEVVDTAEKIFSGWDNYITTMPDEDTVIRARWSNASKYVEIIFGKKGLSKDEVEEMIEKYTDSSFAIVKIEMDDEEGSTKAIIQFISTTEAAKFVKTVYASSDIATSSIKRIDFVYPYVEPSYSGSSEESSSSKGSTHVDPDSSSMSTPTSTSASASFSSSLRPLALLFLIR